MVKGIESGGLSRADELIGKLVLLRPDSFDTWDTSMGASEVVVCHALIVGPTKFEHDGEPVTVKANEAFDVGDVPIFWQVIRRTLASQTRGEFVATRIVLQGRAYVCESPNDEELNAADEALAKWQASAEANDGEGPY
jgi:hypothetical protein